MNLQKRTKTLLRLARVQRELDPRATDAFPHLPNPCDEKRPASGAAAKQDAVRERKWVHGALKVCRER